MTSATLQAIEPYFEGMENCTEEQQIKIATTLLLYASRACTNTEARNALRSLKLPKEQVIQMREAALSVNRIVWLKYPLLDACFNSSIPNLKNLKKYCANNGVDTDDALILKSALTPRTHAKINRILRRCQFTSIPHPSYVERECDRHLNNAELRAWTNRFVFRKLRGFYNAENMEQEDYVNDLLFVFARSYKYARPYYSKLHSFNYAKRAIHHAGIRKISFWTANKRALLLSTSEGYTNSNKNLMAMAVDGNTSTIAAEVENSSKPIDAAERSMFLMSLNQIQRLFTGKKLEALKILSLENVPDFVVWYNMQTATNFKCTREIFFDFKNEKEYIEVVRKYLKITPINMAKLLFEFRDALNGTNNSVVYKKSA